MDTRIWRERWVCFCVLCLDILGRPFLFSFADGPHVSLSFPYCLTRLWSHLSPHYRSRCSLPSASHLLPYMGAWAVSARSLKVRLRALSSLSFDCRVT
jgi:hypothetical protein